MNTLSEELYNSNENRDSRDKGNIISLMTFKSSVAYLYKSCTLRQGLEKMRYHKYTAMPVIDDDGTYIGTVSEGDFLRHILDSEKFTMKLQESYKITDILREGWNPAVKIRATVSELLVRVMEQNFVPVVDDRNKFVGIVTRKSVIQYYRTIENLTDTNI